MIEVASGRGREEAGRLIVPIFQGGETGFLTRLDPVLGRMSMRAIREKSFRGETGEAFLIIPPGPGGRSILLLGLGSPKKFGLETLRRVFGSLARRLTKEPAARAVLELDTPPFREKASALGWAAAIRAIAIGWILGGYAFSMYKTDGAGKRRRPRLLLSSGAIPVKTRSRGLTGSGPAASRVPSRADLRRWAAQGAVIGDAVNFARDLSNTPANDLDPERLAEHAREVGRKCGLGVRVLGKAALHKEKMGGILGVSQGSDRPPCLIVLEYRPRGKPAGTVALVGKAVTFDSGGLSIKPAKGMEEMKYDMAGGAAVLGAMKAIAYLKPRKRVVGILPAAENVISGSAMRPGDVIRSAAGKTIEVVNTDAEGRLLLADALHYSKRFRPDYVLDFATLTGACLVALGNQVSGMVTNDRELGKTVFAAGERSGDRVWELPLYDEFIEATKSQVADIKNSAGRNAGALTAAAFLHHFVGGLKWCHLDIAGTAWAEKESGCFIPGATGVGVRLAVEVVMGESGE